MKVLLICLMAGIFIMTVGFKMHHSSPGRCRMQLQKKQIRLRNLPNLFPRVRLYGTSIVLPAMEKWDWETGAKRPS